MEEMFEFNANREIEDMDFCYLTKDTSVTLAPLKNQQLHPPY